MENSGEAAPSRGCTRRRRGRDRPSFSFACERTAGISGVAAPLTSAGHNTASSAAKTPMPSRMEAINVQSSTIRAAICSMLTAPGPAA